MIIDLPLYNPYVKGLLIAKIRIVSPSNTLNYRTAEQQWIGNANMVEQFQPHIKKHIM